MSATKSLDACLTGRRRTARKPRRCFDCEQTIPAGHVYAELTVFPGHDLVKVDRPTRYSECSDCAIRHARDELLGDPDEFPDGQTYRYWLGDSPATYESPLGDAMREAPTTRRETP